MAAVAIVGEYRILLLPLFKHQSVRYFYDHLILFSDVAEGFLYNISFKCKTCDLSGY